MIPYCNERDQNTSRPLSDEEAEKKTQFEAAYKESQQLPRKERKAYMRKAMEEAIPDKEQRKEYVERNNERKKTNVLPHRAYLLSFRYCRYQKILSAFDQFLCSKGYNLTLFSFAKFFCRAETENGLP